MSKKEDFKKIQEDIAIIKSYLETMPILKEAREKAVQACLDRGYYGTSPPGRVTWCCDCKNFVFDCTHLTAIGIEGKGKKK